MPLQKKQFASPFTLLISRKCFFFLFKRKTRFLTIGQQRTAKPSAGDRWSELLSSVIQYFLIDTKSLIDNNEQADDQIRGGFVMNFLANVKKQELEKYRTPSWSQAVAELCRFIRRYLRDAEAESALRVKPDLLRVDKVLLDRLTIFLHGQTVIVTPLSMNDSRAPAGGGCIVMQSTNGVTYNLLWDGSTSAVRDHWKIIRAEDHGANKVQLDRLTVFFSGPLQDDLTSLDESRLDEALLKLFGLVTDTATEAEAPTVREESPIHLSTPVSPLFQQSVRYSAHANFNGRRATS